MKINIRPTKSTLFLGISVLVIIGLIAFIPENKPDDSHILSYTVNPKVQEVQFFWKDEKGKILKNFQNVKAYTNSKNQELLFAMNGGMFKKDFSPQGLFIQNFKIIHAIDTMSGTGNFYLKPNGVFYITSDNIPVVSNTTEFINNGKIKYATQSGPMLVINGTIHEAFKEGSKNLNIRNGVGILPDNKIVFAMSKKEINFYDFAKYFQQLGCKNALYLDGYVSRTYLPEQQWIQTDGNFGVMIGVTKATSR